MEPAVAFEFELDVEILVDSEFRCKFGSFLALESDERTDGFVCEQFLHLAVAEHTARHGVANLEGAGFVLAGVTPGGDFQGLSAFRAVDGVSHGLAFELASVSCV